MLFSDETIAATINSDFEPVWVSLRPVPRVTVDFGNGKVINRTLHGNVATVACSSSGAVLDILPGVYRPETYLQRLADLEELHRAVAADGDKLRNYHVQQADELAKKKLADTTRDYPVRPANEAEQASADLAIAHWPTLRADTEINETTRRQFIHEYLKDKGSVQPEEVTKWVYRELLHADLDDPWLGLGESLFGSYPFGEEDEVTAK